MKKYILIALLVQCFGVYGQDPHFSQYFASPLTVNPSFTGKKVSQIRVTANTRSQWWGGSISPYNTSTLSVEHRLMPNRTGDNDYLAVGVMFLSDGSNNNILKNNYGGLSVAYNKSISSDGVNSIGTGLSVHYANRILDVSKMVFQNQFGSMGFQRSIPSNDFVAIQNNSYVDFNVGVNFSHTKSSWGYTLGLGYYHAGRPMEGVYNNNRYQIDPRLSLNTHNWWQLADDSKISFNTITHWQGKTSVVSVGGVYEASLRNSNVLESINMGLYHRFGDSFYPYFGVQAHNWLVGISYDMVTSQVKTVYNSVQSLELSFSYLIPSKKTNTNKPKDLVQF